MSVTPFSDDLLMNTIARAHGDGVAETTAKLPAGDQGRAPVGARDVGSFSHFGQGYIQ